MNIEKQFILLKSILLPMGDTEEKIAATLKKYGITGQLHSCKSCPIHNFLLMHLKDPEHELLIDNQWFLIIDKYRQLTCVRDFIREFDSGTFPSLIDGIPPKQTISYPIK